MRDGVKLELLAAQDRRMSGESAESVVLPPHVLGAAQVMHDAEAALSVASFKAPVAEQRTQDHLDLHGVGYDAPENALRMFPHAMNVGTALPAYELARSPSATSSRPWSFVHRSTASARSTRAASPSGNGWPSSERPAHDTTMTAQ